MIYSDLTHILLSLQLIWHIEAHTVFMQCIILGHVEHMLASKEGRK